jgi:hypothetical protein
MTRKWEERETLMEEIEIELKNLKKEYYQLLSERDKGLQTIATLKNYIEINLSMRCKEEEEQKKKVEEEKKKEEEALRKKEEEKQRKKEEEKIKREQEEIERKEELIRQAEEEEDRKREEIERREEEIEELRAHIETKTKILEDRNNYIILLKGQLEEINLNNRDLKEIVAKHEKKIENQFEKLQVELNKNLFSNSINKIFFIFKGTRGVY